LGAVSLQPSGTLRTGERTDPGGVLLRRQLALESSETGGPGRGSGVECKESGLLRGVSGGRKQPGRLRPAPRTRRGARLSAIVAGRGSYPQGVGAMAEPRAGPSTARHSVRVTARPGAACRVVGAGIDRYMPNAL
jgi:hypothetical protein